MLKVPGSLLHWMIGAFCCYITNSCAQSGLIMETWSGVNSLELNPAAAHNYPQSWDIHVIGGEFQAFTNFVWIEDVGWKKLLNSDSKIRPVGDSIDRPLAPPEYLLDYYRTNNPKTTIFTAKINGPSVLIKFGEQHTAGFISRIRVEGGSTRIPPSMNFYTFDETPLNVPIPSTKGHLLGMAWLETGVQYAYRIPWMHGHLALGGTVKYLTGYEAGYFLANNPYTVVQLPNDSFSIKGGDLEYGFTTGNTNSEVSPTPQAKGSGVGLDLGVMYQDEEDTWRAGLSIMDLGNIHFSDHVETHSLPTQETWIIGSKELSSKKDLIDVARVVSRNALGDSLASLRGSDFSLQPPLHVNIHGDVRLHAKFRVGGMIRQRIRLGDHMVPSVNQWSIYPRFESRYFTGGLHIGWLEYQEFQLGLSARLGWLVVGTDDLISFFGRHQLRSADFYIGLKVQPIPLHIERSHSSGSGTSKRKKRGKDMPCYEF